MSVLHISHELGSSVTVRDGDVDLFTYVYQPATAPLESPKPYLHPIRTRRGDVVSLFRPHDHVWHKGIAWALPVVNDENFWGGPTYVHGQFYVQLPNNGTQQHEGELSLRAGEGAVVAHELRWITESARTLFTERRTLTAQTLSDDAWALTFDTQLTNVSSGAIAIGSPTTRGRENAGYGGLFWRGPRSFTGGTLVAPGVAGTGDDLRGSRHEWMGFAGTHDDTGAKSLVLVLDDTANPHHPPQWFARTEEFAALNPAPFFSEEVTVEAGETVRFRYAVGIADGGADDAGPLADMLRGALAATIVEPALS